MTGDPVEEFFGRQREANRRTGELMRDVLLTAGAFVLDRPTGIAAFFGRALGLASEHLANRQVKAIDERVGSVEERLRALQSHARQGVQLRGAPLQLLVLMLDTELAALWEFLEAEAAVARLELTPESYRAAAQELEHLGLVYIDGNASSASGIARTRLVPTTALRLGPDLRPDIDWENDVARILVSLERDREPGRLSLATRLVETTTIPVPRLDLLLRALHELALVEGSGPGHPTWGEFHAVELTIPGRRVLRGQHPVLG